MVKKIPLIICCIFVLAISAFAQLTMNDLINAYEYAVESENEQNMLMIQKAIEKDQTLLGYIMANRPDLYSHFSQSDETGSSVLVGGSEMLEETGKDEQEPGRDKGRTLTSKQQWALENAQRVSDQVSGELEEKTVQMIVSGVGDEARRILINLIKNELAMVKFVRETKYKNSRVEYQIELRDTDLQAFAYSFDNRRFGSFTLDLMKLDDRQAEFLLKRN